MYVYDTAQKSSAKPKSSNTYYNDCNLTIKFFDK